MPAAGGGVSSAGTGRAGRWGATATAPEATSSRGTARFRLRSAARIHVVVSELAPRCVLVGSYVAKGKRGLNVLHLRRRVHAKKLHAGIYRYVGVTDGRRVFAVRVRLNHKHRFVAVPHMTNLACGTTAVVSLANVLGAGLPTSDGVQREASAASGLFAPPRTTDRPWLETNPILRALNPENAPLWLRPLLFVMLALSIGLLSLGSVPLRALPGGLVTALVIRNRAYVVGAGITLLLAVATIVTFS
jgi:hypothetical protein